SALDLATAAAVVAAADRANGGLLVDTWHLARTRDGAGLLETIPGARIGGVQISDSPPGRGAGPGDPDPALPRSLLAGEGTLDLVGFVRLLDVRGSCAPIGVEVCSERLAAEPPEIAARWAGDAIRQVLAAARRS